MSKDLAFIAEGGGARGAYVYGAMQALEEVFNDQYGLANFTYMAATSVSALTMMYALSGQFHSDGLEIWTKKVSLKKFMDQKDLKRFFIPTPLLNVEYLIDEILEKQHPFAWNQFIKSKCKFYIPLIDVKSLNLNFYTNDTELNSALLPYDLIFMDKSNPSEIYSLMKAAIAAPVFYNREVEIQGRTYVDGAILSPFPLTAPIPSSVRRICILTKPKAPKVRWYNDRFMPSVARSGFLQGGISNSRLYSLASETNKNYQASLEQMNCIDNCLVIKPYFEMSGSGNSQNELARNMKAGFDDTLALKDEIQSLFNSE